MAGLVAVLVAACRGGHAREDRPPAEPGSAASARAPEVSPGGIPEVAAYRGMPKLSTVLGDPRLADVRVHEQARDWSGAARSLALVRATVTLDRARACEWDYLAGRFHLAAGDLADALAAFEQVSLAADAGLACGLAPYALLREAQTLVRMGRYDDAVARAVAIDADIAAHDEAELTLADGYVGQGNRAAAVPIWRGLLGTSPHGLRWADSSLELATALLDGIDGPAESRAQEAFDLATRVLVEAPGVAEKMDVIGLRARASQLLPHRAAEGAERLRSEERAEQAQAWLESGQPKRATELAESVLKALPRGGKAHHEAACRAAIVRAQAKPRGKPDDAADAWGAAIARCDGDESLVTALYYGGKASASAHRPTEALERFGRVEKLFPRHRLADDASFRAAVLACDEGDEARGLAQLASLPDTYPDGDMGGEALFRVALAKLGKRDLGGARDALDRLLLAGFDAARSATERAEYFRARVAQLSGDADDAERRYTAIVTERPLGYYMLLAYARLRAMNEAGARVAMETSIAREPPGDFLTREHSELKSPAFDRFVRLLEVGEIDSARREAHAGGLVGDGVDPEVLWTVAWLYDVAGAPELGHSFARSRLLDYREHWPVGRWRVAWEAAFPRVWEDAVARESEASNVPAPLTWAIMREESAFNADARSVADAIGLMQLIAPTARATARGTQLPSDEDALRRPEVSIALGTRLLSSLRSSFPANPALAIAAYNCGSRAVRRWLTERGADDFDLFVERIPYDETRAYLKRVLASEAAYAYLYAPKVLGELLALPMSPAPELVASP
jgi:soluble lytic murein transglycosylase